VTGLQKFEREWAINPFLVSTEKLPAVFKELMDEKIKHGREIRILLVDDLITSGSTLSKASLTLKEYYPRLKIWGGGIGFRPSRHFH
jgi:hypoxanthine phosphoribosyltransferase